MLDPPGSFQLSGRSARHQVQRHERVHARSLDPTALSIHLAEGHARHEKREVLRNAPSRPSATSSLLHQSTLFSFSSIWTRLAFNASLPFPSRRSPCASSLMQVDDTRAIRGIPRRIIILQFWRHAVHRGLFFAQLIPQVYRMRRHQPPPPPPPSSLTAQQRRFARSLKQPIVGFLLEVGLASSRDTVQTNNGRTVTWFEANVYRSTTPEEGEQSRLAFMKLKWKKKSEGRVVVWVCTRSTNLLAWLLEQR